MKRLLSALKRRGYNAELITGSEYDYIKIDDVIQGDYIEISAEDNEVILVTENSVINAESLKIADIESALLLLLSR